MQSAALSVRRASYYCSLATHFYSVMIAPERTGCILVPDSFALHRHQAKSGGTSLRELLYNASMRKGWKPYIQCYGVPAAS